MSTTKLEIINLALGRTYNTTVESLSGELDDTANKALMFYKRCHNHLLSVFPWSFAIERRQLTGRTLSLNERVQVGYNFVYDIPQDARFIWEIYLHSRGGRSYPNDWDYARHYYVSAPYVNVSENIFYNMKGEFLDGKLYSDATRMWCLLTSDKEIPTQNFSTLYAKVLEDAVVKDLLESKQTSGEEFAIRRNAIESDTRKNLKRMSRQNAEARKNPVSEIQNRIDDYMGW